jgi:hypothetical protein
MTNFSATIPNPRAASVNAALDALGFGPNSFSIDVRKNPNAQATHKGLHMWVDNVGMLDALIALNEPGLQYTVGNGQPNFNAHLAANGMNLVEQQP